MNDTKNEFLYLLGVLNDLVKVIICMLILVLIDILKKIRCNLTPSL